MVPLAFLNTVIMRGDRPKFKVYRKPTNKESYVHFYSGHHDRVKSGIVLGFFLRAYRICSEEFIDDEIQHIMTSFAKLKYPKGYLVNLKRKAQNIRKRPTTVRTKKNERYITLPNSKSAEPIAKQLETTGLKVAFSSGQKTGDALHKSNRDEATDREKSVVYRVPCGSCDKSYIGETGRGLEVRLKEHKRDFRNNADHSAFVIHAHNTHHIPKWRDAEVLTTCKNRDSRKATEAAFISTNETINIRVGSMKWAKSAARFSIASLRT